MMYRTMHLDEGILHLVSTVLLTALRSIIPHFIRLLQRGKRICLDHVDFGGPGVKARTVALT